MKKIDIKSLTLEELRREIEALGMKNYRANQLFDWLHKKQILDFDRITNISSQEKALLENKFCIELLNISKKLVSSMDNTVKYLYALSDGEYAETVVMRYKHGRSLCLSVQAGCKMGCSFCASAKNGFGRDLSVSEMLEQVYISGRDSLNGCKFNNLVLMGIGEPLDNYQNLIKFLKIISSGYGYNMGIRNITVSTCGIADRIYELAETGMQITLSVSLHAPNDAIRSAIMPINKKYDMNTLFKAVRYYVKKTNRRVTFEYALINGINDRVSDAEELSERLRNMLCHVNLIPVNRIKEAEFTGDIKRADVFKEVLFKRGINVTVRRTLGADINAACGQLRREAGCV